MPALRHDLRGGDAAALATTIAERLSAGEIVVLPTETVYGFAASLQHAAALERLHRALGRGGDEPFVSHLAGRDDFERFAAPLPEAARRLADRYWPGPLSIVVPVRDPLGGMGGARAFRVPGHAFARDVAKAMGGAIALAAARAGRPTNCSPSSPTSRPRSSTTVHRRSARHRRSCAATTAACRSCAKASCRPTK
jgi:tRNA A37 threonylcarbamoyladenosine synthetase subunit TsaC/SUA5/YrdC